MLDTRMWYGNKEEDGPWFSGATKRAPGEGPDPETGSKRCIRYGFYKKPMASKLGILKRSAIQEGTKVSTAVAEILKRWKLTSLHAPRREVEEVMKEYADCLTGMGYSKEWKVKVLTSALRGYQGILQLVDQGKVKRNRFGKATATARRYRKLLGPSTWYKKQGAQNSSGTRRCKGQQNQRGKERRLEGVLFVPHTPFSTLKQKLQAVEDSLKFAGRIKVVETVGPTVGDRLVNKDPWGKDCGRPQCMMCKT